MSILHCAVNGAKASGLAYFFSGDHYVVYDWNRVTTDNAASSFRGRAIAGPFPINETWSLTLDMLFRGFGTSLSAGMSADAGGSPAYAGKLYLFRGANYVRFDHGGSGMHLPDSAGSVASWKLGAAFANDVRGALNGQRSRLGYAYFFKGANYVRYIWSEDQADPAYPKPISTLVGMPESFWAGIDAAVDGGGPFGDFGYLIVNDNYCRYNWETLKVDNGPWRVWQNWPGVLELLLAAQAKAAALTWIRDAREQLDAYLGQITNGVPSRFNAGLMEAALQTHFHSPPGPLPARQLELLPIRAMLEQIEAVIAKLADKLVFHDDGEVKAHNPKYVGTDGTPDYRAYTGFNDHIYLTSRFLSMCDNEFTAAAVLIHEAVHLLDAAADAVNDSPEWYVSGKPKLTTTVQQNGVEVTVEVTYYDLLTAAQAVHNPSSYAAFCQHVSLGADRRYGVEARRAGY